MNRRCFMSYGLGILAGTVVGSASGGMRVEGNMQIEKIHLSEAEWKKLLTEAQFDILRREGTEPSFSSELLHETRAGEYRCAGCELPLFTSDMKYDSGTGWPSFFDSIAGRLETKTDYKLILPRTEYHCARCGGHHGHIFKDGPPPTRQRWCNNGAALIFVPAAA